MIDSEHYAFRVLVADDDHFNRVMIKRCLEKLGHETIMAENGQQAVDLFKQHHPDVVLLDIVMPEKDGFATAQEIRQLPEGDTVPLMFLSALEDDAAKVRSYELADDFIAKPIQFDILRAKLNSYFRQIITAHRFKEEKQRAENALMLLEEETEIGVYVLNKILDKFRIKSDNVQHRVMPASLFSGDLVLLDQDQNGNLYALLADAVGHGLSAALNLMPLFQVFGPMTKKGLPIVDIMQEINRKLCEIMPIDRFVATTMVHLDVSQGLLSLINAGNPPVLLFNGRGHLIQGLPSQCVPLRLADIEMIAGALQVIPVEPGDGALLFSDGVVELGHANAEQGLARILEILKGIPQNQHFQCISTWLDHLPSELKPHDDASLISLTYGQSIETI